MSRWRTGLTVGVSVLAVALLLWLPTPKRSSTAGTTGPATLASVWPGARTFPIAAVVPDGGLYTPALVLDPTASMGVVASTDGKRSDLAVVSATGAPRVLQSQSLVVGGSFDGLAASTDRLYWMHTVNDAVGHATVSLWTARRDGGPATQVTADVGAPVFYGSQYDVQVVGDRVIWAAGRPDQTELRSVPLAGGPVTVRVVPGSWALSAWPWLVTAPSASGQPPRLHNVDTGAEVTVRVPANKQVSCSPVWCRMIPGNAEPTETELIRPDGSDRRLIGDANAAAIASDVALRDRFELLMTVITTTGRLAVSRLDLYDIAGRRTVQAAAAATNAGARGDYLWWSTGDNETLTWHGLDLRTLT